MALGFVHVHLPVALGFGVVYHITFTALFLMLFLPLASPSNSTRLKRSRTPKLEFPSKLVLSLSTSPSLGLSQLPHESAEDQHLESGVAVKDGHHEAAHRGQHKLEQNRLFFAHCMSSS